MISLREESRFLLDTFKLNRLQDLQKYLELFGKMSRIITLAKTNSQQ